MKRISIPPDDILKKMSHKELNKLANEIALQCAASGSDRALEYLSDALIRIHRGWRSGAHSEISDTRRRRRIVGSEIPIGEHTECIATTISDRCIRKAIVRACKAGLSRRQQEVWVLHHVAGWSTVQIAAKYGISQPAASQCLKRARQELWDHIDRHDPVFQVFMMESNRSVYLPPEKRPMLPPELDEARRELESQPGMTTHIQADALGRVEVWCDGKPATVASNNRERRASYTLGQILRMAKQLKKSDAEERN